MSISQGKNRVIVTGASGWLGRVLCSRLICAGIDTVAVSRQEPKIEVLHQAPEAELSHCTPEFEPSHRTSDVEHLQYVSNAAFMDSFELKSSDIIVHAAFCRKSIGAELVESMQYSSQVFCKAAEAHASLINISSQSVYGTELGMAACEQTPLNPGYLYSLAKASTEVLLGAYAANWPGFHYTSLRLASLMGASQGHCPTNVISKFIDRALAGDSLKVVGGRQMFSFLDVEDAVDAIMCLINKPSATWEPAYTITPDEQVNIMDVATIVATQVASKTGKAPVKVTLEPSDTRLSAGGSNALAKQELGWAPKTSFEHIVGKMVEYRLR